VAAGPTLTLERVQSNIHAIEARQDLEEPLKNQLLELYRQAKGHLDLAQAHAASTLAYQQAMQSAPAETERIHQALEQEPGLAIPQLSWTSLCRNSNSNCSRPRQTWRDCSPNRPISNG